MMKMAAGERISGRILENGCGVGIYLGPLSEQARFIAGMDIEWKHASQAYQRAPFTLMGAGEKLPFMEKSFDLILSHEVLEHVQDDQAAVYEMVRVLAPGGRLLLFCPNRGYPYETHGVYWKGVYHFGNIPLVNYLPRRLRDRLAPHVNIYTTSDLEKLFRGLPVKIVSRAIIFGAYDNIIQRWPFLGKILRSVLLCLEKTPLQIFGLSHFWVVEKI